MTRKPSKNLPPSNSSSDGSDSGKLGKTRKKSEYCLVAVKASLPCKILRKRPLHENEIYKGGVLYFQIMKMSFSSVSSIYSIRAVEKKKARHCFQSKAWFPYRCICRSKKIHRTDKTLWKPPVQMLNTKETTDTLCCKRYNEFYLSYEIFSYDRHDDMETRLKVTNYLSTKTWKRTKTKYQTSRRQNSYSSSFSSPGLQLSII